MKDCRVKQVLPRTPKYVIKSKKKNSETNKFSAADDYHEEIGKVSQTGKITKTNQSIVKKMVRRRKNRLKKRKERRIQFVNDNMKIENEKATIEEDFDQKKKNKQPLYELDLHEIKLIQKNNLHLTNYSRKWYPNICKGISRTTYNISDVGINLRNQFQKQKMKRTGNNLFLLKNIKNNFMSISVDIDENMRNDPNLHIISNGTTGKALILLATFEENEATPVFIDSEIVKMFKQYKYNLASKTTTTSHFGSEGHVFGTGIVPHYHLDKHLSFGEYCYKKKNGCLSDESFMNATVNTCMKNAISSFQKVIKNVDQWLFLVSSVVHEKICREKDNIPWNMTKDSIPVFLSSQFNINATTKYSHTERDSSYTIIHVPSQEIKKNNYYFHFQISNNEELQIKLEKHVSMCYSSYMLTHSQRKSKQTKSEEGTDSFVNISSYFSKRLYDNIVSSLHKT